MGLGDRGFGVLHDVRSVSDTQTGSMGIKMMLHDSAQKNTIKWE